jgi:hypothetical protein
VDAGFAVGAEDEPKHLRHEAVVGFALGDISELGAVGAGLVIVLDAAGAHRAPGRFVIGSTTGAFPVLVFPAGSAVQPTIGDQFGIIHNHFHGIPSC